MTSALKAIEDGKKTRDELNAALKGYYSQYHKGSEWSDTVVNTMRSGLFSRLNELGLVRREKHGKYIRYHITEAGEKYIQNISEKDEVTQITKDHQGQTEPFSKVSKI
jgi:predicted transcriptional regulator